MSPPDISPPDRRREGPASADLVLVDVLDGHGRVTLRQRFALGPGRRTITIGRGLSADVTLDDPHAAALHASVEMSPNGGLLVTDLGSLNGLVIGHRRVAAAHAEALPDGQLQVGRTRLRLRSSREALAPEKIDAAQATSILRDPLWLAGLGGAATVAQTIYGGWLGSPRDLAVTIVGLLVAAAGIAAVWVAAWGLLTRILQGEWRLVRHAAIALGLGAALYAASGVLDLVWFMAALPGWANPATLLGVLTAGAGLYLHLMTAAHLTRLRAGLVACLLPALVWGGSLWVTGRSSARNVNHIAETHRIYPPALRLRAAESPDTFFARTKDLRDAALRHRSRLLANDPEDPDK